MDILVISGFLGAGKTTFIKELVKKTNRDYCVLENEFGAINIDKDVLEDSGNPESSNFNKLEVYELTEGCICCSSKGEFASTVLTISNSIDPDYLIIEPTGVGYLSSIISNLNKVKYERINILNPITIVDGEYVLFHKVEKFDKCLIDQIESTNVIIVSKLEHASSEEKSVVYKKIRKFNEKAEIYLDHYSNYDSSFFFNLLKDKNKVEVKEKEVIEENLESFSLTNVYLKNLTELIFFLEDLIHGEFGKIYRFKGFIRINKNENKSFHFEVVDKKYAVYVDDISSNENSESKIVFIGKRIKKEKIRKRFYFDNVSFKE